MTSLANKTQTTLGVNAAFLQEVKDSNLQLWSTLRELREIKLGVNGAIEASRQFVNRLGELRDCVALEFTLEETYGFIDGARPAHAFGSADAKTAKTQHRELYLQLHDLCEQAEEAQYRGTISRDLLQFIEMFDHFDGCFRAHEDLETELIRCGLGGNRHSS